MVVVSQPSSQPEITTVIERTRPNDYLLVTLCLMVVCCVLGNPMAFIFLIPALILSLSVSNLLYYIQWFILKVVMGMLGYNLDDSGLLVSSFLVLHDMHSIYTHYIIVLHGCCFILCSLVVPVMQVIMIQLNVMAEWPVAVH